MKYKHQDLLIEKGSPFANCKLNRQAYAEVLDVIIENCADGFVLAIDGKWGTGKSTFVKMWQAQLDQKGFNTLHFNAWENDFIQDPMVGIIGEMNNLVNVDKGITLDSVLNKGGKLVTSIMPALFKTLTKRYVGDDVSELIKSIVEESTKLFTEDVKQYKEKKKTLLEFKEVLRDFIRESCDSNPLIFFIDELDRCRPDYAVEVLEKIKHFFSIPGIIFVLSIDKEQLGNSIRGFYGSDRINADEYLRRFIDVDYKMPDPDIKLYCNYLYNYFEFDDFFFSPERLNINQNKQDKDEFLIMAIALCDKKRLSLRQIEKLFTHTRLVVKLITPGNYVFPGLLYFLIYLKFYHSDLYQDLKSNAIGIKEMVERLESVIPENFSKPHYNYDSFTFAFAFATIIQMYNNGLEESLKVPQLYQSDFQKSSDKLLFNLQKLDEKTVIDIMKRTIVSIRNIPIGYVVSKIDLLEQLN